MNSKAAVLHEPTDSREFSAERPATVESIAVEEPTGEEVLVEIGAASLCHTDVAIALGHLERVVPIGDGP